MDVWSWIGWGVGIGGCFITIWALIYSIRIYDATGEYYGITRKYIKDAMRYYLVDNAREQVEKRQKFSKKAHQIKYKPSVRLIWRRFIIWLFIIPINKSDEKDYLQKYIDNVQINEIKRKMQNKYYSKLLVDYGFGGIIAYANNPYHRIENHILFKGFKSYFFNNEYDNMIKFIKVNFGIRNINSITEENKQLINEIIERILTSLMISKIKEEFGIALYLFWLRSILSGDNEIKGSGARKVLYPTFDKFDNGEFYKYYSDTYKENMEEAYYENYGFGSKGFARKTFNEVVINYLMLYKHTVYQNKNGYVHGQYFKVSNTGKIIKEDNFDSNLKMVGGSEDNKQYVIDYIKKYL